MPKRRGGEFQSPKGRRLGGGGGGGGRVARYKILTYGNREGGNLDEERHI